MDLLANGINALVVGVVGLALAWLGKGQFDGLRAHVESRFQAVDREFGAVNARIDRLDVRMQAFQSSLDALRSDLTQVALAVGVKPRAGNR